MDMIDIFKEVMQDGMEIVKCKEMSNKYKITLSYNGMNATCELNKLCTPGNEKSLCMRAIDTAMSTMYIDNGNYQEAKAWLDGERWNEKKGRVNKIIPNLQKVWDKFDKAYENLEAAFEMLEDMVDLPEELQNEMDRFDLSAVSSLKQQVEMMIENKKNGV